MSNPFGSSNLFSGAADNTSAASYAPPLGLRQRHSTANGINANNNNGNLVGARGGDENANPNNSASHRGNMQTAYGKWGSMSKVPAPPRASLSSTAGKFAAAAGRSATAQQQQRQQLPTEGRNVGTGTASHQAIVSTNERVDVDLSLWVVGYGYRREADFRALYHRLERCGVITARRGGLPCFGESRSNGDNADNGSNWVAVRYESALCAQKALCQHGSFVSLGGSTMVMGVMPLSESDAAAKLGINFDGSASREVVTLSGSYNRRRQHELRSEADIMLHEGERGGDGTTEYEVASSLDSLCGKVLAWFFMWDTQA